MGKMTGTEFHKNLLKEGEFRHHMRVFNHRVKVNKTYSSSLDDSASESHFCG